MSVPDDPMTRICCICGRVEVRGIGWRLPRREPAGVLTHGYCPDCYQEMLYEMQFYHPKEQQGFDGSISVQEHYQPAHS